MLATIVLVIIIAVYVFLPTRCGSRMAANEASAYGRIRAIHELQAEHAAAFGGEYACQLSALVQSGPAPDEFSNKESLNRLLESGESHSYRLTMEGCVERQSRTKQYRLTAVPNEPGKSGVRAFCMDESGAIWFDADGSAERCFAMRVLVE